LIAHATKRWAKKIRGRLVYHGSWDDPDGALAKHLEQNDALRAGLTPRPDTEELTIKDLANAFLNQKSATMETGELSIHTFNDYKRTCDLLGTTLSLPRPSRLGRASPSREATFPERFLEKENADGYNQHDPSSD
jgi:hypothetical protein